MGNFLSNMGLVSQGMDEANLTQQKVQTGQIGLDELQRQADNAKVYRASVSGSDPDAGRVGMYNSVSKAALGSGDLDTYNKAQEASKKLQDEGFGQLAMGALTGKAPAEIESQFNQYGVMKIQPGTLEWGKDPASGDILARGVNQSDGKPYTFNATQYAKLHGLIKGAEYDIKDGVIFNKNTGDTRTADTRGDWIIGSIVNGSSEVPIMYNKRDGAVQQLGPGGVRTNLEAKVYTTPDGKMVVAMPGGTLAEFKPSTDGTPTKTNFFSADTPGTPAQPARVVPAQDGSPPVAGARKAADGNWYVKTANGYARVNIGGQPAAAPSAAQPVSPAAAPAPSPTPTTTPAEPTQAQIAKQDEANYQNELERQDTMISLGKQKAYTPELQKQVDAHKAAKAIADKAKEAADKAKLSSYMNSPASRNPAFAHANGGKVTRQQQYGIE